VRRVVAGTGKVLITVGILILLFVVYQLWGTGIYTARQQNKLENQFEEALREASASGTTVPTSAGNSNGSGNPVVTPPVGTTPTTVPVTTTTQAEIAPIDVDAHLAARIVIPKIEAEYIVVQGVDLSDLRDGPGHYPSTPYPGQVGNAAIAGHRTTYGAPFGRLDDLEPGDVIRTRTVQGAFEYVVYEKFEVNPDDVSVLDADPARKATLTLTTCHPPYSAAKRLIVKAELQLPPQAEPLPSSVDPNDPSVKRATLDGDGLSGNTGSKTPTVIAGLLMLLVGLLWWLLFHRHPRWTTWFIGVIPFAVTLAIFYFYLERALPANY
jgi:sortase A